MADGCVTHTHSHTLWVYICLVRSIVLKAAKMDAARTDTHSQAQVVIETADGRCDGVGEEDGRGACCPPRCHHPPPPL